MSKIRLGSPEEYMGLSFTIDLFGTIYLWKVRDNAKIVACGTTSPARDAYQQATEAILQYRLAELRQTEAGDNATS